MQFLLYMALIILFMMLSVTIVNFFTAPKIAKSLPLQKMPKVSVLIPARNEEHNIEKCLEGLTAQNYSDYEIIVLDDQSHDGTVKLVTNFALKDSRIRLIQGKPLPDGWTGKNWACHQLSKVASGDIFIFTDADNQHAPLVITNTVAWIENFNLGLISAFPQQRTQTLAEKLVVPIMDIFVYGTLPLWLTYYAHHHSLAAANGQWIAFTREAYHKIGGHAIVRNQLVEDTELSRIAKRRKIKILTTAGTGAVFCRMYHSAQQVWEGFSKNFYGLTGYNLFIFWGIIMAMFIGFVSPYFLWILPQVRSLAIIAIGLNFSIRALLAVRYKHPFWTSVLLHPIGILYSIAIGLNSFFSIKKGLIKWKDREFHLD